MKLLITTQAVDLDDSVLGFFHAWIVEFSKHYEKVTVICLREGRSELPANVKVFSLGKEKNISRISRWFRALRYITMLSPRCDAVFVHMNPEYIVLGGLYWRLLGKKIALWYTHKNVDLKLRIATAFANVILTASKESFRIASSKVHVLGHGIDTAFFTPDPAVVRGNWALSVGRLSPSKRHDLAITMAAAESRELRIAGEGPERRNLENLARELKADVHFLGGLTQARLRDEYRSALYFIHTSETGSLDKVVLEALACGLRVKTNDPALKRLEHADFEYVRREHSLERLIPKIVAALS